MSTDSDAQQQQATHSHSKGNIDAAGHAAHHSIPLLGRVGLPSPHTPCTHRETHAEQAHPAHQYQCAHPSLACSRARNFCCASTQAHPCLACGGRRKAKQGTAREMREREPEQVLLQLGSRVCKTGCSSTRVHTHLHTHTCVNESSPERPAAPVHTASWRSAQTNARQQRDMLPTRTQEAAVAY